MRDKRTRLTQTGNNNNLLWLNRNTTPRHQPIGENLTQAQQPFGRQGISNLSAISTEFGIKGMLTRMIDFLKNQGITALFTSLTSHDMLQSQTEFGISSLMDTWLQMEGVQSVAERKCLFSLVKSRGMPHSNQVRRLLLTNQGIQLADINADQIF